MGIIDKFVNRYYKNRINKTIKKQIFGDDRFNQILFRINEESSLVFIGGIALEKNELSNYTKDLEDRVTKGIVIKQQEDGKDDTYTLKLQITDELEGYLNIIPHALGTSLALGVQENIPQNFKPGKIDSFRTQNKERYIFVKKLLVPEIDRMQKIKDDAYLDNISETSNKSNTKRIFSNILKNVPSGLNPKQGWIEKGKQRKSGIIKARAEVHISGVEEYRDDNFDDLDDSFAMIEVEAPDKYIKQYMSKLNPPKNKDTEAEEKENDKPKEDKNDKLEENSLKHYIRKISDNKEIKATFEVYSLSPGRITLGVYINKASLKKIYDKWDMSMRVGRKNARKAVSNELNRLVENELMGELTQLGDIIIEGIGQDR